MKTCTKCKIETPATSEFFYKRTVSRDGLGLICKICAKAKSTKYNIDNNQKTRAAKKEYRENNKEKVSKRKKDWWAINSKEALKRRKFQYDNNINDYKTKSLKRAYADYENITDNYLLRIMKVKNKNISKEILETRRLTIKIKRVINKNN